VVRWFPDGEALARGAAEALAAAAERAVAERGAFTLALSGGETPRRLYALLADPAEPFRGRVPWARTHVFFVDERHVPPDHAESNYGMARDALLSHVALASVHRIAGELADAVEAAARYEEDLRAFFASPPDAPPPALDLVLLGIGADGHTASLFPGSPALEEDRRWVAAQRVERLGADRITLTLAPLCAGRELLFLASGAHKADAVAAALLPPSRGPLSPAARVHHQATGTVVWLVDAAAASRLPPPTASIWKPSRSGDA
jgi:6-phosphogluconolactonase